MASKKIELNDELKELVKTKIAVLPKEQFAAFEKYIIQLGKTRAKADKDLPKYIDQLKARGYQITEPGTEEKKAEPVPAVEALKEVVKPGEKPAEVKPEEKKSGEKKPATAAGGNWPI